MGCGGIGRRLEKVPDCQPVVESLVEILAAEHRVAEGSGPKASTCHLMEVAVR